MPGMNSGLNLNAPAVVAAFRAALLHQGLIVLLIFGSLGLAWVSLREWLPSGARASGRSGSGSASTGLADAGLAPRAASRIRPAVAVRRDLAGTAADGGRTPVACDRADRGEFTAMGAGRRELGRDVVVLPPAAGKRRGGVDPDRDRDLDARRRARHALPGSRASPAPGGVWWCGFSARHSAAFSPRTDLAVRRARRGAALRGGWRADRAARACLA